MGYVWHKTKFPGVRYREHPTRKNGSVQADRYFTIRLKLNGKVQEEAVGWSSAGVTAESAHKLLSQIRENIRLGSGPTSLAGLKKTNEEKAQIEEQAKQEAEAKSVTFKQFWDNDYYPFACTTKKPSTMNSERWLYSKWLLPLIGNTPLNEIDVPKLEKLMTAAQKDNKSAATIR